MGISRQAYLELLGKTEKSNKYGNKTTCLDGYLFASKREANRYCELKLLEKIKLISGLTLQPVFLLQPKFRDSTGKMVRAIKYIADFQYVENGKVVVEDVKGFKTAMYRLKEKMFLSKYPSIFFKIV